MMRRRQPMRSLAFAALISLSILAAVADAAVVKHTFVIKNVKVRRNCTDTVIATVNGEFPGPTIRVTRGDTLVVRVLNHSPYNLTIHWHGIFQKLSIWMDGPETITQCPIQPKHRFTYRFNITDQEGTLWWHAHSGFLRSTLYGALIISPKKRSHGYPFPKPHKEFPILLGEWFLPNMDDMYKYAFLVGSVANRSDGLTINGKLGDLDQCNNNNYYHLEVEHGKTYLLRIINSALDNELFFKIAGHKFTVVSADASYTTPYATDVVVLGAGNTVDVLMVADAAPSRYSIACRSYISLPESIPLSLSDATTVKGILTYKSADPSSAAAAPPVEAEIPPLYDTPTAQKFFTSLTSLVAPGFSRPVPKVADEHVFTTMGMGFVPCKPTQTLCNQTIRAVAGSMNNISFDFPKGRTLLEAFHYGWKGVYTTDFPDKPPMMFNFTDDNINSNPDMMTTVKARRFKKVKYNATVEVALQNTAFIGRANHPMHLHGFNFFVLAQGFGNYNAAAARKRFNLVNPPVRNTLGVPRGGWAVIRFVANNPGIWFMHCHLDSHMSLGMGMAFVVENGGTPESTLPPPPPDYPKC